MDEKGTASYLEVLLQFIEPQLAGCPDEIGQWVLRPSCRFCERTGNCRPFPIYLVTKWLVLIDKLG